MSSIRHRCVLALLLPLLLLVLLARSSKYSSSGGTMVVVASAEKHSRPFAPVTWNIAAASASSSSKTTNGKTTNAVVDTMSTAAVAHESLLGQAPRLRHLQHLSRDIRVKSDMCRRVMFPRNRRLSPITDVYSVVKRRHRHDDGDAASSTSTTTSTTAATAKTASSSGGRDDDENNDDDDDENNDDDDDEDDEENDKETRRRRRRRFLLGGAVGAGNGNGNGNGDDDDPRPGDVEIVAERRHERTRALYPYLGVPFGKLQHYCTTILDPRIFLECRPPPSVGGAGGASGDGGASGATAVAGTVPPEEVLQQQPCTRSSYIVKTYCAHIDYNSANSFVPGTIILGDGRHYLRPQQSTRAPKTRYPNQNEAAPNIHYYDKLASALQAYPLSKGHHIHEVLPRVLWLNKILPPDVPILIAMNPFIQRYYTELQRLGVMQPGRLLPWGGTSVWRSYNHVYYANEVWVMAEAPYCQDRNPHAGGTTTYYPGEMIRPVHVAFTEGGKQRVARREGTSSRRRGTILVIQRKRKARRLRNHEELMYALERQFGGDQGGHDVRVFDAKGPFHTHVEQFQEAVVVIAPHGAGLANLVFCLPGTTVIEIGYDSRQFMNFDNMYGKLSTAAGLDYWLVMGKGDYKNEIVVDVAEVVDLLQHGGQRYDRHKRVPIKAVLHERDESGIRTFPKLKAWRGLYRQRMKEMARQHQVAMEVEKKRLAAEEKKAATANLMENEELVPKTIEEEEANREVNAMDMAGGDAEGEGEE